MVNTRTTLVLGVMFYCQAILGSLGMMANAHYGHLDGLVCILVATVISSSYILHLIKSLEPDYYEKE